uniref:SRCR domain-containing protein n=1 Tax=Lepisosteus oculatus TaxID=7918 RepID=W5LW05_LEPOC
DVMLVNGASPCEGTVEIHYKGEWGTVLSINWDLDDAAVVCRELVCGSAFSAPGGAHFGPGTGSVLLSGFNCRGSESVLRDCGNTEVKQYNFAHNDDAGVRYSGVRLAGGRSLCSGRVEVLRGMSWGTICEADFEMKDAEVVCRELDCGFPAQLLRGAHFGEGQGPIRTEEIQCQGNETRIHNCPTSTREHQSCTHSSDISLVCTEYSAYRLVGGPDSCSGWVELQYRGEYRTVCDQYWDLRDATVLCQQLGCREAVAVPGQAWFGQDNGSRGVNVFECHGNETHLSWCALSSWGRAACSHGQEAGVICSTVDGGVRLSGGESHCDGLVEVHYNRTWARLIQHSWGYREASVVCRQLGCGSLVQIHQNSVYETGDSAVCLTGIQCSGDESHLVNCSSPQRVNCGAGQEVSLLCSGRADVRLVNGASPCEGTVEIHYKGEWGTVLSVNWDLDDAAVVCRQLGCGSAVSARGGAHFGPGSGSILLGAVSCSGSESALRECGKSEMKQYSFPHSYDAGVRCSAHQGVRLVGGSDLCSGRVEVQHGETWDSVCDSDFDWRDAEVVCRELDCGVPSQVLKGAHFGKGGGEVWTEELQCQGNESQIFSCPKSPTTSQNCTHENNVGLVCFGYTGFRLVNGSDSCSGRVELQWLFRDWGTVCDLYWDLRDASVLCQQLGCGEAVAAPGQAWFGQGSGPVLADVFECQGNESRLSHCAVSSWGRAGCSHGQDAGVICSGENHLIKHNDTPSAYTQQHTIFMVDRITALLHTAVKITNERMSWNSVYWCCTSVKRESGGQGLSNNTRYELVLVLYLQGSQCALTSLLLISDFGTVRQQTVYCISQRSLRLVGAGSDCAGRLEVYHNSSWGTVCDDSWDLADSQVVCRQLQCGTALS